jgi:hypothetical protein
MVTFSQFNIRTLYVLHTDYIPGNPVDLQKNKSIIIHFVRKVAVHLGYGTLFQWIPLFNSG